MTTTLEAKAGIRQLTAETKKLLADDSKTVAEKNEQLEKMTTTLKGYQDVLSLDAKAKMLMAGGDASAAASTERKQYHSLGEELVDTKGYEELKELQAGSGRYARTFDLGMKAASTVAEGTAIANGQLNGNAGILPLPNYLPGIVDRRYAPLAIGDLFAQGSTSSPIVSYAYESAETQGAAATAEASPKPKADLTLVRVNEQVGKIAVISKQSDEIIQDAPQLQSFLSNRLTAQVQREEDNELLNGTGYPSVAGVLGRSGLQPALPTTGTDPKVVVDAIFNQITNIQWNSFVIPDTIVMNPYDWAKIRLAKDSNDQYLAGGPFTGAYGNGGYANVSALWGYRVVTTPRIVAGTILIGGFNEAGQLFRRLGVTVEIANQNEDDFKNNLITIRAESRAALAIYRPDAFGTVTATWAAA